MKNFAIYKTQFGNFKIEYSEDYIIFFKKIFDENITDHGTKNSLTEKAYAQLLEYFSGKRKKFDLPCQLNGTDFQKKVWQALCEIPYGETRTYKEVATAVGNPKASRAIGLANNKNPIAIIYPCHRVIGSSGKLVGYAGGLEMKESLLKMEAENK